MIQNIQASSNTYTADIKNKSAQAVPKSTHIPISNTYKNSITFSTITSYTLNKNNPEDYDQIKALENELGNGLTVTGGDITVYDVSHLSEKLNLPLGVGKIAGYHSVGGSYVFTYRDEQGTTGTLHVSDSYASSSDTDIFATPSYPTEDGLMPTMDNQTFANTALQAIIMKAEADKTRSDLYGHHADITFDSFNYDYKTKTADLDSFKNHLADYIEKSYTNRNHNSNPLSQREAILLNHYLQQFRHLCDELLKAN